MPNVARWRLELRTNINVDDVTMTEIIGKQTVNYSVMQAACDEVENWSKAQRMNINQPKVK